MEHGVNSIVRVKLLKCGSLMIYECSTVKFA